MGLILEEVANRIDVPQAQLDMGITHGFEIIPSVAYPRMIGYIRDVIAGYEYVDNNYYNLKMMAMQVSESGWSLALNSANGNIVGLNERERSQRAQALETARLWLTELLHQSVNQQGMYLHIVADKAWKL